MNNKIPKIIHYCWFGGNPLPEDAKKYIESWKKYCPDYEIIEWNEENFDVNCNDYVKEAYNAKKWAFVSDYARLYALVNYGGIYMDTDVEVIKSLDSFLKHDAFSGFETDTSIPTGIMGCKKNFELFKEFLDYYNDKHFLLENGEYNLVTNVATMTKICEKYNLNKNNEYQEIKGFVLYPKDYFCPKDHETGVINLTENTFTIHHFAGSWLTSYDKNVLSIERIFIRIFGKKIGVPLTRILTFPYKIIYKIKKKRLFKDIKNKLKRS